MPAHSSPHAAHDHTDSPNTPPSQGALRPHRDLAVGATLVTAIVLNGLVAGFFFAFQVSVVRGFATLDDLVYVAAFQSINATIRNAPFGIAFFGAAPATVIALVALDRRSHLARSLVAAALLAGVGTLAITVIGNIPLNRGLEGVALDPAVARAGRDAFEASWNSLNLARTVTSTAALGLLACASAVHGRHR